MNNKDIQTLIEMEADKKYLNLDDDDFLDFSDQEKLKAFKHGANFALSLFKWRKVSEGLPDVRNEAYQVLVYRKYKKEEYKKDTLWIIPNMSVSDSFKFHGVTEWMPIPQID